MSYSILGSGQQKKRQAIATFDSLADQERARNDANEAIELAEDQQVASAAGTATGMAAEHLIAKGVESAAVPIVEKGMTTAAINSGPAAGGTTAVAAGGSTAAGGAAAGGAASSGGALAALGPAGWALGAGLLAYSVFS